MTLAFFAYFYCRRDQAAAYERIDVRDVLENFAVVVLTTMN